MATGILDLTRRASLTLVQGVSLALLSSIAMGAVLPIDAPTDESWRGEAPTCWMPLLLWCRLGSGLRHAPQGIPAALAGVAIAAALMPPLCTTA